MDQPTFNKMMDSERQFIKVNCECKDGCDCSANVLLMGLTFGKTVEDEFTLEELDLDI
jgi:hypothetical protein